MDDSLKEGKEFFDTLATCTADRLRPILSTSLTTVCGLLPTAYGIGGYEPILVPMTMALAWGLVGASFLVLIWIPCGYAMIYDMSQWKWVRRVGSVFQNPDK